MDSSKEQAYMIVGDDAGIIFCPKEGVMPAIIASNSNYVVVGSQLTAHYATVIALTMHDICTRESAGVPVIIAAIGEPLLITCMNNEAYSVFKLWAGEHLLTLKAAEDFLVVQELGLPEHIYNYYKQNIVVVHGIERTPEEMHSEIEGMMHVQNTMQAHLDKLRNHSE